MHTSIHNDGGKTASLAGNAAFPSLARRAGQTEIQFSRASSADETRDPEPPHSIGSLVVHVIGAWAADW